MPTLPISAKEPYRFNPFADRLEKAREALADAERDLDEAKAKAEAHPEDANATAGVGKAEDALKKAEDAVKAAERATADNPDAPVYLLTVPTFRTNAAMEAAAALLPPSPGDRKMFAAIKEAVASGLIQANDPLLLKVEDALKEAGAVPQESAADFNALFDRADEHPAVRGVIAKRIEARNAMVSLKVRTHLISIEGEPPFKRKNGAAAEEVLDDIPPNDVWMMALKIDELGSVRGRVGKSSATPSPSPASPEPLSTEA